MGLVPPATATSRSAGRSAITCRRWKAASTRVTSRSCTGTRDDPLFKGAKGNEYNLKDLRPHFEVVESAGGLYIGRGAIPGRQVLLAIRSGCCLLHPDSAARGPSMGARWVPWTTRTAGYGDQPPCRAAATTSAGARGRQGHHRRSSRDVPARCQQGQRLPHGSPGAEGRPQLLRRRGFRMQDARSRKAGADPGPPRENLVPTDQGIVMARRRLLAASAWCRKEATAGNRSRHQRVRSVPSSCRRAWRSATRPAMRWCRRPDRLATV